MTIRVDLVWRRHDGGWGWEIKGYEGRGIYVMLATDADGKGIFVIEGMTSPISKCIVSPKEFKIAKNATRREAVDALELALVATGWGPVIRDGLNKGSSG